MEYLKALTIAVTQLKIRCLILLLSFQAQLKLVGHITANNHNRKQSAAIIGLSNKLHIDSDHIHIRFNLFPS